MITTTTSSTELPDLVHRYLSRVLPAHPRSPETVHLVQRGTMQLKPDGRQLSFTATEDLAVADVAFSWQAKVRVAPFLDLHVTDSLAAGQGSLRATLLGVPTAGSRGQDVTVGEAMRYLAELPWVPYAMLANRSLRWSIVDESIVEVAATVGGTTASIGIRFNDDGDVLAAFGHRPHIEGPNVEVRPWVGIYSDYAEVGGIRIPTRAEVRWETLDGPFTYFRAEIIDVR